MCNRLLSSSSRLSSVKGDQVLLSNTDEGHQYIIKSNQKSVQPELLEIHIQNKSIKEKQ